MKLRNLYAELLFLAADSFYMKKNHYLCTRFSPHGALAHLARALDWQSKGDEFESRMLHKKATNHKTL